MWRLVIASVFAVCTGDLASRQLRRRANLLRPVLQIREIVLTGRRSFHWGNHHLSEERSLHGTQHPLRRVVPPHTGEAICSTQAVSVDGWPFGLVVAHFWEVL